ncbi:MAG: hypothetical protein ACHQO8_12075 [Vicinamibacterales bacterium]
MTMWHPTDEDLILHFYGDGGPDEERRIDEHLGACSTCRQSWAELGDTLKMVDAATVPEPGDGFERTMWARVQTALPSPASRGWTWRLVPAIGFAAVLVTAVALGSQWWSHRETPRAVGTSAPAAIAAGATSARAQARDRERVLLSALDDHFQQTELLLVELMNAPDEGRADLSFERATADDLVASGRLYRVTARQNGDLQFAQMLDDLESVLVEVARSPEHVARKDFKSLRSRIDDQSLLFKVRAVTNQIHARQKDLLTSSE